MGVLGKLQTPYAPLEAWFYDRYIASQADGVMVKVFDEIKDYLDALPKDARVLDVGCGGGHFIFRLAEFYPTFHLTGLDLSPGQIRRAKKRALVRSLGSHVRFVEGSALALPFANESFDLVLSLGSIKHWPDARRGLLECLRVIKPGQPIVVGDTDRDCNHDELANLMGSMSFAPPMRNLVVNTLSRRVFDRSPNSSDMRMLIQGLPLSDVRVDHVEGLPIFLLRSRKA